MAADLPNPLLAAALRYIALGWPVLPLRGKIPRVPNGSKEATLSPEQARLWWGQWPDANVGVATGHRFWVLDVDIKGGGEDSFDALERQFGSFDDATIRQVTGTGGWHLLYAMPEFPVRNSAGVIAPGIDVRGVGGYIVVAPSIHPDTKREYFWDGAAEIEEQRLAPAPAWLLDRLRAGSQSAPSAEAKVTPLRISEGGRNTAMFKLAASLRRKGLSDEEILATLRVSNEKRCAPPLPASELETIAKSAARYQPDQRANVFRPTGTEASPAVAPVTDSDAVQLSAADVEAAVDAAIAADDLPVAMRLIPEIASVPAHVYALIQAKLRKKFRRDFPVKDFARAVRELAEKLAVPPAAAEEDDLPPPDAPDLLGFPLTDSGNGERLVKLYGEDIRFCPEFKKWLLWDGRRWKVDTDAAVVTQKAKNMARLLHKQGSLISDRVFQKTIQTHARDSESQGAISSALLRAKSEPGMALSAADLDKHRYLLNCLNGVVDVRTGDLLPFERRYYITKVCHVNYRPESAPERDCPRFLKFLHWAMGETADMAELPERVTRMVAFLQKSFGYALTGDVSEKAAFIFYGAKGNNGKTTLLTIFKTILAEYATQLDINTLMTSKFTDNNVRADLAKLHGARFVITSEVDDGQRLSERLMKYLTAGMGEITACRKFENPFEFLATHKIWMDCNYRPEIKGADEAIWNRLKCVPFLQRIDKHDPEIDKQLLEKILAESEGVLAWAVRGAMRWWKEQGLGDPPEVEAAGAEWRDADDPLKGFFEECCEVDPQDPHCWVRCADFTRAYQDWCKSNNEPQLKSSRLTQRLALKGITLNRSRRVSDAGKQARCWDGVRMREDVTLNSGPRSVFSPQV